MKKVIICIALVVSVIYVGYAQYDQTYKTIIVSPSDADIFVNQEYAGRGTCRVSFADRDRVQVELSCDGYKSVVYTLFKSHVGQEVRYTMARDPVAAASVGGSIAAQIANQWVSIKVGPELSPEDAWKRLVGVTVEYFEYLEREDRAAGWIRSIPVISTFGTMEVRTVFEVLPNYAQGAPYKARLSFDIRQKGSGESGWKKYDRLLNRYKDLLPTLTKMLGGSNGQEYYMPPENQGRGKW